MEILDNAEDCVQRVPIVHVYLVLAGPMESLAGQPLQAGQVDVVTPVGVEIFFREIINSGCRTSIPIFNSIIRNIIIVS